MQIVRSAVGGGRNWPKCRTVLRGFVQVQSALVTETAAYASTPSRLSPAKRLKIRVCALGDSSRPANGGETGFISCCRSARLRPATYSLFSPIHDSETINQLALFAKPGSVAVRQRYAVLLLRRQRYCWLSRLHRHPEARGGRGER